MESDPAPFVKPNNTVLIQIKKEKITLALTVKLSAIQNIRGLKNDLELLKYACSIVENLIHNRKYKDQIDVKEIVIEVLEKLTGAIDKQVTKNSIQFLYDNKQILPSGRLIKLYGTFEHWFVRGKKKLSA